MWRAFSQASGWVPTADEGGQGGHPRRRTPTSTPALPSPARPTNSLHRTQRHEPVSWHACHCLCRATCLLQSSLQRQPSACPATARAFPALPTVARYKAAPRTRHALPPLHAHPRTATSRGQAGGALLRHSMDPSWSRLLLPAAVPAPRAVFEGAAARHAAAAPTKSQNGQAPVAGHGAGANVPHGAMTMQCGYLTPNLPDSSGRAVGWPGDHLAMPPASARGVGQWSASRGTHDATQPRHGHTMGGPGRGHLVVPASGGVPVAPALGAPQRAAASTAAASLSLGQPAGGQRATTTSGTTGAPAQGGKAGKRRVLQRGKHTLQPLTQAQVDSVITPELRRLAEGLSVSGRSRLPLQAVQLLRAWLLMNDAFPYPDGLSKRALAAATGACSAAAGVF